MGKGTIRNRVVSFVVPLIAVVGLLSAPAAAGADPTGGDSGARWTATHDGPPLFPNVHVDWDVPITMSDGITLKANVYRPANASGAPVDTPFPTIVNLTPYTKLGTAVADAALSIPVLSDLAVDLANNLSLTGTPFSGLTDLTQAIAGGVLQTFAVDRKLIQSGYTQVIVDVRGTGFSQGTWQVLQPREQQDSLEVIDWAAKQPWSNGKVGMTGLSYSAINIVQAAALRPPALQAIFLDEPSADPLRDLIAPGGAIGIGFLPFWLAAVNGGKWLPNVQSMLTGNFDGKWLADRIADPLTYVPLMLQALTAPTTADIPPQLSDVLNDQSDLRKGIEPDTSNIAVPAFVIGGWHDVFTNSEPRIYDAIPLPTSRKKLVMGDTYHLSPGSGFGNPGHPPRLDVLQRAWFDKWLKGIDNGIDAYGPVILEQQGGGWSSNQEFPRTGMTYRRMYLDAAPSGSAPLSVHDGSLTSEASRPGRLTVGPGVMSLCSRDSAQVTTGITSVLDMCGKDSRVSELNALTFTSAPVDRATTISGPVNLHLNTILDAPEGYWSATLNDVAPDGTSTVLTSGQLTASLRAIDDARSGKSPNGDYTDPRYYLSLDKRQPHTPGQPTALDIGLTATDAVIAPGHRIRVDVYAANVPKGLLVRPLLNESALKPQHIELDPNAPSYINVPLG